MQYGRTSSFDRFYRKLDSSVRSAAEEAITRLVVALDSGKPPEGLGLKKLQRHFWEIRAGLAVRVLFKWEGDLILFVMAGTHDQVRRYLKGL